jgi:GWxTD domain-containing protein
MNRIRLTHILLCMLLMLGLVTSVSAQDRAVPPQPIPSPYQKWLDEDVAYIITDEERADLAELNTDRQRDKFVEDFWQRRNPDPQSGANPFKEEHYRRLAYVNQHFAANIPGWKTDRGRIYIMYGPPDEREQHPGSAATRERYPSDVWRYHTLKRFRDVYFEFIDKCRCGRYELSHDPTQKSPGSKDERLIPVLTGFQRETCALLEDTKARSKGTN